MYLLPIEQDETLNANYSLHPECREILQVFPGYYAKIGFVKPWIGYFASLDGKGIVGAGGFKGKPINRKVEIAYSTFKEFEGRGIGKEICKQLVALSLKTDSTLIITARTLENENSSASILKQNGFSCKGTVQDEEDGTVWEWVYSRP
jgi:[ribosomal protein S5]-alanine N-acetyltransferase